jgi:ribosomal protein S18 acetylase RimI-like enzyme
MILRDWRDADAALMQVCYARERQSWQADLGWDTSWTWTTVEQARVSWGLPGVLACDEEGSPIGWAFAMRDGSALHIGGVVAVSARVTAVLLDALLGDVAPASNVACFVRERAPGLGDALTARGLTVERFLYLRRPVNANDIHHGAGVITSAQAWRDADFVAAASLLQGCYAPVAGRYFAPSGTFAEWAKYLSGVVQQAGCGLLDRTATRVARDADGLQALALVTTIGAQTMHLAQLAVRPSLRGSGVATRLLREAIACAAAGGAEAMTLLVGEHNHAARRLYASLGFVQCGSFVAAPAAPPSVARSASPQRELLTHSVC